MPSERRGSVQSTDSFLNYVYINVMPMKENGKPTHKELYVRVKRNSKKGGSFRARKRDDGFFYRESLNRLLIISWISFAYNAFCYDS